MRNIVLMFPGVGSQHTGMGKDYYEKFKVVRDTFEEAGEVLRKDIADICFNAGKSNELNELENAQCALFTLSIAIYRVFMAETGVEPRYCIGHSLGEYSALCSAGVINFSDALRLIKERGEILHDVSVSSVGTMIWIINLDSSIIDEVCREMQSKGHEVYISAYNTPLQTSISGSTDSVMKTAKILEDMGALVYPLNMSGPFHCPLMKTASHKMKAVLQQYSYNKPVYPVISNRTALPYDGPESVVENLSSQLTSPIRWTETLNYISLMSVDTAIEIGPKDVLKYIIYKNGSNIKAYSSARCEDFINIRNQVLQLRF